MPEASYRVLSAVVQWPLANLSFRFDVAYMGKSSTSKPELLWTKVLWKSTSLTSLPTSTAMASTAFIFHQESMTCRSMQMDTMKIKRWVKWIFHAVITILEVHVLIWTAILAIQHTQFCSIQQMCLVHFFAWTWFKKKTNLSFDDDVFNMLHIKV